jgi:uncharacterized protein YbjT (DUF2867 family)
MKKVIVIGATGVVGSALVELLANSPQCEEIICFTRRPVLYKSAKITNHIIDFEDLEQHSQLISGDCLFSCLGTTKKQAGSISAQRRVDLDYQLKFAQLAAKNKVVQYYLVSSTGANKQSNNAYLKMKGELEDAVNQLKFSSISIFQPSLLLGQRPEFRLGEYLASLLFPIVCKLPYLKRYRPITGYQVAQKMFSVSSSINHNNATYKLDQLFELES